MSRLYVKVDSDARKTLLTSRVHREVTVTVGSYRGAVVLSVSQPEEDGPVCVQFNETTWELPAGEVVGQEREIIDWILGQEEDAIT